jgi:hypothetical protein
MAMVLERERERERERGIGMTLLRKKCVYVVNYSKTAFAASVADVDYAALVVLESSSSNWVSRRCLVCWVLKLRFIAVVWRNGVEVTLDGKKRSDP